VATDGRFTTDAVTLNAGGVASTVRVEGRFSTGGFEGDATVTQQPPTPACRYVVHWTGTKQGAPNTLP
jgi:hypothetical protein